MKHPSSLRNGLFFSVVRVRRLLFVIGTWTSTRLIFSYDQNLENERIRALKGLSVLL
jgi:hypothetical protein